jgi:hypothetical protein
MQVTPEQSPGAMMSAVHAVLIYGGCFLGNVRVMMSVVHAAVCEREMCLWAILYNVLVIKCPTHIK